MVDISVSENDAYYEVVLPVMMFQIGTAKIDDWSLGDSFAPARLNPIFGG